MQDVVLIGVKRPRDRAWEVEEFLDELKLLAQNLDMNGRFRLVQKREAPDPATFVGSGMVEKIHNLVVNESLKAVIFDDELSPSQQRNLEKLLPVPVYDRTFVILSIFLERAKTKEAKAQVDLARLKYEYPRLKKMWSHLHRQAGGTGIRGGEGEKQLEVDRRIARRQMQRLEKTLKRFEQGRNTRKKARSRNLINIALVGYTNAGKSTLMNQLTKASVEADDRLFVTLDATSRLWHVDPVLKIVLSDTVGFIRKLPHDLVASFHSTLTEVREADLLFHVIDACHPHLDELQETVRGVIDSLVDEPVPTVLLFNKIDGLSKMELKSLKRAHPDAIFISALEKVGMDDLREFVRRRFQYMLRQVNLFLPTGAMAHFYRLNDYGQITTSHHLDEGIRLGFRGFRERIDALLREVPELEIVEKGRLQPVGESQ
ncbi:GTPase HflX [Sulfidibacter corallicola]|uniref:GTPase HflX n=1 Tax=Sulfidibacter corallicola TaxID=2818388 RepID=A0A8A4TWG1_SULCO|nr:GTPase HflX [Sulfidibacter corallicola]QTD53302.1 GTPase HflX [Sulfidibacter corallicola]